MSLQDEYDDKVDDILEEILAVIAEHTDEAVTDEEFLVQQARSLAEDAVSQYLGSPDFEEGDHGVIEYHPDMDEFEDE